MIGKTSCNFPARNSGIGPRPNKMEHQKGPHKDYRHFTSEATYVNVRPISDLKQPWGLGIGLTALLFP